MIFGQFDQAMDLFGLARVRQQQAIGAVVEQSRNVRVLEVGDADHRRNPRRMGVQQKIDGGFQV